MYLQQTWKTVTVHRHTSFQVSKIVGSIGKVIENIFSTEDVNDHILKASATYGSSKSKIKKFIKEYSGEGLFIDICDRHHTGFQNCELKIFIRNH